MAARKKKVVEQTTEVIPPQPESRFAICDAIVADIEGGYWDDPDGGPTMYGISQNAYPDLDIKSLTEDEAREIRRQDYWKKCRCDELPHGLDHLVYDAAVNQGGYFAAKALQAVVGATTDGIIGPKTLAATREYMGKHGLSKLVNEFAARRGLRYGSLESFRRNGWGWMRRLMRVHEAAVREV